MQLVIKNFCTLKTGEIDLSKRFYVFVGYNNSGKTYVSHLLWAIFNEKNIDKFSKAVEIEKLNLGDSCHFEISQELIDNILNKLASFLTEKVIPEIFNVEKNHLILEGFSIQFKLNLEEILKYNRKSTSGIVRVSEKANF
jgi:predicted ATPase